MADDEFQVAQAAPKRERTKQPPPQQERPAGDGDRDRRPAPKDQRQRPPGKDNGPVLPPWIGMGIQMGTLEVREADHNSIVLASAGAKPHGPNEIS